MIGKLAGMKWKLWLIGGLVIVMSTMLYQYRSAVQNAAQWSLGFHQLEAQIQRQQEHAEKVERRWQEQTALQSELTHQLNTLQEERRATHDKLLELEQSNEEVAEWSDAALPCALVPERLRAQAGARCSGGGEDGVRDNP